ncbi:MAG: PSD1 and planctomycete cytochrome C domain-containing protein [Bryobacteraceae bacterium]|nr:PSD1 and planctomycete cytochrome C domain-containing protein [Bryobacteraceae bacterium]
MRFLVTSVLFGVAAIAAELPPEVSAVLQTSCLACHTGAQAAGQLRMTSASDLLRGGASGPAVVPGNPEASPLLQRVTSADKTLRMPPAGEPLHPGKIAVLRAWIETLAPQRVDFARDVEPILKANCYACHSAANAQSQLRLDAKAGALRGGMSGPVIVAGRSADSRLIHRVTGAGGEQRMPLKGTPLSEDQIATLRRWIDLGAPWPDDGKALELKQHWSYVKPRRPAVPAGFKHPIDAFVATRLSREGLKPSAEASKEKLIRRLSLDLTGLPPSPQEMDDFLADTRPGAYERLVDRLLASPHYGERWARPWLDLARYADTNGYEKDLSRRMWKYRDWVVHALNRDLPFDHFTVEQIAGDLLPDATNEQKIATGFHRNTMFNEEGGVDKDEAHHEVLIDRVNTTATVWLGATLACAQCHNHKYDPFTQKDYYRFYAFFNNSWFWEKSYGDTSKKNIERELTLPTPEQEQLTTQLRAEIDALDKQLKTHTPQLAAEQKKWERDLLKLASKWKTLQGSARAESATRLVAQPDGSVLATGANPQSDRYLVEAPAPLKRITALRVEALPHSTLPRGGPGRDIYGNFVLTDVVMEVNGQPVRWRLARADQGSVRNLATADRKHLWTVDASREETRVPRQLLLIPESPLVLPSKSILRVALLHQSEFHGQGMGRFRISVADVDQPERTVQVSAANRVLLSIPPDRRTDKQRTQLEDAYRAVAPSLDDARKQLAALRRRLDAAGIDVALVMEDRPGGAPSAPMRIRGSFLSPGEIVTAGVPSAFPQLPEGARPDRLALARWLVSPDNPLTARVHVNRIWEQYFGRGLVETSEDFGSQGERPSHPELLDWLALEFMERGWSQKALHRLIVTSATYKQDSRVTPDLLQRDPYNRLLARGPRFRMEAETVRDAALMSAGLLSRKIGGPSVFPYQPEGVWDLPYSNEKWVMSKGEDRYRRGLYTFARRTAPYPSMLTFDAPSREFCAVRRVRTNTPLQALTTLNDPVFFEAAQAMAARVLKEAGSRSRDRAVYAFRLVTGRQPNPNELDRLLSALHRELAYFKERPAEAAKIASEPETAAWTMIANVLLNLDEALTKD